jgi:predicted phosphodiesterase
VDQVIAQKHAASERLPNDQHRGEWEKWVKSIGQTNDYYRGARPAKRPKEREKILVIPDLHVPFHHEIAIAHMIAKDGDADRAVVMGDVGDAFALSRFIKYESLPYEQEIVALRQMFEMLSGAFPKIDLIAGNHDGLRLEKTLRTTLNEDFIAAVKLLTDGCLSPVDKIASKFKNISLRGHAVDGRTVRWFTQIGDALFTHAEAFSRVPGAALRRIEEWVTDMERTLKLSPWRVIVQAHTHQLALFPWMSDKLMVECGCLSRTHGYQLSAKLGGRPQRLGYVVLEQTNGITDLNTVRTVWLDDVVDAHEAQQAVR